MREAHQGKELRRCHRTWRNSPITFTVGPADIVMGTLRDISVYGLGIHSTRYLCRGSHVGVHVPGPKGPAVKYLAAEVRHATSQPGGGWILGCKLLRPLTVDEVMVLG
jgi:hypothetical protein